MTRVTVSLVTKEEDAVAKILDIKEVKLDPRSEERMQVRKLMRTSWGEERNFTEDRDRKELQREWEDAEREN